MARPHPAATTGAANFALVGAALRDARAVQGIYLQGSKLRVLDVVDMLKRDLGVPVVHPAAARTWKIRRRLTVRQPRAGYGRLLAEMPVD